MEGGFRSDDGILFDQGDGKGEPAVNFQGCKGYYMGVSENGGTPKSSILIGFSIINHPFWGTPIFGNTHIEKKHPSAILFGKL